MKNRVTAKHNIDFMFLIVVFLLLTFCSLSMLIMSISSYRGVVNSSDENASARTACNYIRETVRLNDANGSISLGSFQGQPAIVIAEEDAATLYIYENDGYLMELNTFTDSGAGLTDGSRLLKINSLSMSKKTNNLLEINIEDSYGNCEKVEVAIKSVAAQEVQDED